MRLIGNAWDDILCDEFSKGYFRKLALFLEQEEKKYTIYPPKDQIFTAFRLTPPDKVKVVILGQDPYHEPGQAHGLSFSVQPGTDIPPSLINIYKELQDDLGITPPDHGCLVKWAEQGVLMLNTVLTVRAHEAMSHKDAGWEIFTDAVMKKLDEMDRPMVFVLWGRHAQQKERLITNLSHLVIKSAHPSPLSAYRGFFGSEIFSKTNAFLSGNGVDPIDWSL